MFRRHIRLFLITLLTTVTLLEENLILIGMNGILLTFICLRRPFSLLTKNLLYQFDGKIAFSPDLVNLHSCFFENKVDIHLYPDISFYRRYINNCLGLIYTKNKWSVRCLLENLVIFNNCTIE